MKPKFKVGQKVKVFGHVYTTVHNNSTYVEGGQKVKVFGHVYTTVQSVHNNFTSVEYGIPGYASTQPESHLQEPTAEELLTYFI